MQPFTYVGAPSRVVFGFGVLDRVPEEVKALGCRPDDRIDKSFVKQLSAQLMTERPTREVTYSLGSETVPKLTVWREPGARQEIKPKRCGRWSRK